jgi:cell division protein FtsZ
MLFEVEQAANRIRAEVDPDANIIFGNTILDDMEGRIRVSVVATGIDAEQLRMPEKVQPLRPSIKPVAFKPEPKPEPRIEPVQRPAGYTNAVHRQHEAIADEMGAQMPVRAEPSPSEAMILGGDDAPAIYEDISALSPVVARPPAPVQARPEPLRAPVQQPEPERRFLGLFGRKKKDEPRMEPVQQRPAPRATAQPMAARPQPAAETPRQPAQTLADDLFPEHKRDEQFEIPAFLRRQSN